MWVPRFVQRFAGLVLSPGPLGLGNYPCGPSDGCAPAGYSGSFSGRLAMVVTGTPGRYARGTFVNQKERLSGPHALEVDGLPAGLEGERLAANAGRSLQFFSSLSPPVQVTDKPLQQ